MQDIGDVENFAASQLGLPLRCHGVRFPNGGKWIVSGFVGLRVLIQKDFDWIGDGHSQETKKLLCLGLDIGGHILEFQQIVAIRKLTSESLFPFQIFFYFCAKAFRIITSRIRLTPRQVGSGGHDAARITHQVNDFPILGGFFVCQ